MQLAQASQTSSFVDVFLPLIPWVVVFVFIWLFVFRTLRGQKKVIERSMAHMDAVEAKLDRLIEVVERRDGGQ